MTIVDKLNAQRNQLQELEQQRTQLLHQLQQTEQAIIFVTGKIAVLEELDREENSPRSSQEGTGEALGE